MRNAMKTFLFPISVIIVTSWALVPQNLREKYANAYRKTPQLIEYYGYSAETHNITTEDGYILTVHRIPAAAKRENYKGPVILQHGLNADSASWADTGSNSFGFLLSEEGYDVWMPNLRGNYYSRSHVKLSKDDIEFWDFSWHESGMYDVPAITDYILSKSGSKDLIYICHSMGCTASFVMLSLKPEYNEKIRVFFGLAPSMALPYATSVLRHTSVIIASLRDKLKMFGVGELFKLEVPNIDTKVLLCAEESVATREVCNTILVYIFGGSRERINQTNVANLAGHYPAGTGRDMIAHYGQGHITGRFAQFDYGAVQNLQLYGQPIPPLYPVEKITVPVYIYHGDRDTLVDPMDVAITASKLNNLKEVNTIKDFAHTDLTFGLDVDKFVFRPIIETLQKISQEN